MLTHSSYPHISRLSLKRLEYLKLKLYIINLQHFRNGQHEQVKLIKLVKLIYFRITIVCIRAIFEVAYLLENKNGRQTRGALKNKHMLSRLTPSTTDCSLEVITSRHWSKR